jgi:hypothetical protein
MSSENDELKAKLMAQAEAAINRMMAARAKKARLTITDIERLARSVGEEVMGEISQRLTEAESQPSGTHECPTCGQKMKDKGMKGRDLITEAGDVWVERRYYYCEHCRSGISPPL